MKVTVSRYDHWFNTLSTNGHFYTALEEDYRLTTSCVKISSNSLTPSTVVA